MQGDEKNPEGRGERNWSDMHAGGFLGETARQGNLATFIETHCSLPWAVKSLGETDVSPGLSLQCKAARTPKRLRHKEASSQGFFHIARALP